MKDNFETVKRKIKDKIQTYKAEKFINKMEAELRAKLNNDNFTILASNCAAGIIYNRLGKQFLSPTINMWFKQGDFIKFCLNIKHYVETELEFIDTDEYDFPVAKLDDIYLFFNHSNSKEEAANNWYRRKNRINYDNLYILMYDRGNLPKSEYLKLNSVKCKNKVVFTADPNFDLKFAYYIKPNLNKINGESYLDRDELTLTTLEKEFDFVSWLNCEQIMK